MIGPTSQCGTCIHFRSPFSDENIRGLDGAFCAAFPDGIPDEVYGNQLDHRQPIPGDNGVRWEPDGDVKYPEKALATT